MRNATSTVPARHLFQEVPAPRRSPWAAGFSLLAHVGMVAAAAGLAYRQIAAPPVSRNGPIRYVSLVERPLPELLAARPDPTAFPAPKLEPPPEPPLELAEPEIARPEPPPVAPKPVAPAPRPTIAVGVFENASAVASTTHARRLVESGGFDAAPAVAAAIKLSATATGTFDATRDVAARGGTVSRGGVSAGGFDQKPGTETVRTARATAAAGFDVEPVAVAPREAPKTTGVRTPVEVLFKPTPGYTEEARARRVEGEVLLEVEFALSGEVRVLRVVRGLGHGLDEMAARAASQIRFKPATEEGRPVDFRAHVQIVFRLS